MIKVRVARVPASRSSRPTEPPVPIVMTEARILTRATRGLIRPLSLVTAIMTSGTPCPLASLAKKWINGPTSSPPAAGTRIT